MAISQILKQNWWIGSLTISTKAASEWKSFTKKVGQEEGNRSEFQQDIWPPHIFTHRFRHFTAEDKTQVWPRCLTVGTFKILAWLTHNLGKCSYVLGRFLGNSSQKQSWNANRNFPESSTSIKSNNRIDRLSGFVTGAIQQLRHSDGVQTISTFLSEGKGPDYRKIQWMEKRFLRWNGKVTHFEGNAEERFPRPPALSSRDIRTEEDSS